MYQSIQTISVDRRRFSQANRHRIVSHAIVKEKLMTKHPASIDKSSSAVLWTTYLLYLLFAPALVGFGINYFAYKAQVKLPKQFPVSNENKEIILSHHQWLMRTFVFVSTFIMIGFGSMYYGVGYVIAIAAVIWWFYRVIKGMVAFANHRRMPA